MREELRPMVKRRFYNCWMTWATNWSFIWLIPRARLRSSRQGVLSGNSWISVMNSFIQSLVKCTASFF